MTRVKPYRRFPLSRQGSDHSLAYRRAASIGLAMVAFAGCAKNHYFVEPNGQVTAVSHQPLFGLKKHTPEAVQMTAVPTEVHGAKIITVNPPPTVQSVQSGVVNPAIPEAVVVQPPVNQGLPAEPPLVNGDAGTNGTQVSGGIRTPAASGTPKVAEGLLD